MATDEVGNPVAEQAATQNQRGKRIVQLKSVRMMSIILFILAPTLFDMMQIQNQLGFFYNGLIDWVTVTGPSYEMTLLLDAKDTVYTTNEPSNDLSNEELEMFIKANEHSDIRSAKFVTFRRDALRSNALPDPMRRGSKYYSSKFEVYDRPEWTRFIVVGVLLYKSLWLLIQVVGLLLDPFEQFEKGSPFDIVETVCLMTLSGGLLHVIDYSQGVLPNKDQTLNFNTYCVIQWLVWMLICGYLVLSRHCHKSLSVSSQNPREVTHNVSEISSPSDPLSLLTANSSLTAYVTMSLNPGSQHPAAISTRWYSRAHSMIRTHYKCMPKKIWRLHIYSYTAIAIFMTFFCIAADPRNVRVLAALILIATLVFDLYIRLSVEPILWSLENPAITNNYTRNIWCKITKPNLPKVQIYRKQMGIWTEDKNRTLAGIQNSLQSIPSVLSCSSNEEEKCPSATSQASMCSDVSRLTTYCKVDPLSDLVKINKMKHLAQELDRCCLCYSAYANSIVGTCGHGMMCERCASTYVVKSITQDKVAPKCPLCRARIEEVNKLTSIVSFNGDSTDQAQLFAGHESIKVRYCGL